MSFHVPNEYRFKEQNHPLDSDDTMGNYGAFFIPFKNHQLSCVASEGMGWEHSG